MFRKAILAVALVAVSMIAMTPGQADARGVNCRHSNIHHGYGKGYLSPWYGGPAAHSHGHRTVGFFG